MSTSQPIKMNQSKATSTPPRVRTGPCNAPKLGSIENADLYPRLYRRMSNEQSADYEPSSFSTRGVEAPAKGAATTSPSLGTSPSWDLYPGALRDVRNHGTSAQQAELTRMQAENHGA